MSWKTGLCTAPNVDVAAAGVLCPMFLYAHNVSRMNLQDGDVMPSVVLPMFGYIGSTLCGMFVCFPFVANIIQGFNVAMTPLFVHAGTAGCGTLCNALYTGSNRGLIREKYGIEGNACCDVMLHAFVQPLALWQENAQIESAMQRQVHPHMQTQDTIYMPVASHEPFNKEDAVI